MIGLLIVVYLKIGVVFSNKHLIVYVAIVVEGIVTG